MYKLHLYIIGHYDNLGLKWWKLLLFFWAHKLVITSQSSEIDWKKMKYIN